MNNIKIIVNLKRDYLVDGEADPNGPLKSKGWHKKSKRQLTILDLLQSKENYSFEKKLIYIIASF